MRMGSKPGSHAGTGLPDLLRFGVEFADGRRATSLGRRPGPDSAAPEMTMTQIGGGGRGFEFRYWVFPPPLPGMLILAIEWPARGVELTKKEIDAGPILEAAARSERLWEADDASHSPRVGGAWQIQTDAAFGDA
jgi:hypothetical protein